jgi:hypothetical protein
MRTITRPDHGPEQATAVSTLEEQMAWSVVLDEDGSRTAQ